MVLLKPIFIVAIVAVAMIGVMVPSVFAETSVDSSRMMCPEVTKHDYDLIGHLLTDDLIYPVVSGSMIPTILVCDIIYLEKPSFEEVEIGDIIVFDRPSDHNRVIVHRVVSITNEDPKTIRTQGDANPGSIPGTDFPITEEEYIGKYVKKLDFEKLCKINVQFACESVKIQKDSIYENNNTQTQHTFVPFNESKNQWSISNPGETPTKETIEDKLGYIQNIADEKAKKDLENKIAKLEAEKEFQQEKITQLESEQNGGGCLIATATYGSELSPRVQQLRELRDNQLLNTESGTAFMSTFNDIYYSFSPVIADYERENPLFKEAVKLAITPMISSLSLMENTESESEVISLGISVIMLNLGMYLGVPAVVIVGIRNRI